MFEFIRKLFDTSDFPARWHCGNWSDGHGWLHVVSDVAIFGAYMAIPLVLSFFILQRRDLPFPRTFALFIGFIAFCGTGHLVEAIIFWHPVYRVSGVLKLGTALVSWATVFALIPTVRRALTLRSPEALELEVTQRTRELAQQKATLEAVVSSMSSGVAVADSTGSFVLFNRAAEDMFGRGPTGEPLAQWSQVFGVFRSDGTPYPSDELPLARILRGATDSVDEDILVRSPFVDGERVLSTSCRSVQSPGFEGGVLVARDITESVEAKRGLERSNADLEQFAYAASHDLKEPLRQLSTFSKLLGEETAAKLDDSEKKWLRLIQDGALRMEALVEGLLRYSQAAQSESPTTRVDSEAVVRDVVSDLAASIEDAGAIVELGALPQVEMDAVQLRQVFQNLIANALKFRGPSVPRISVSAREEVRYVQFSVADNGIGIAEEHLDRIFRVFQRLHTQQEIPGTGIGLSICKRLIERRGGTISVESVPGKGTTFHFTIPREVGPNI